MSTSTCRAPAPPAATSCPELASWEGDLTHRASLCLRLLGGRPVTLLPQMLLIRAQSCSQGQGRAADTEDSLEQSSGAGTGQVDRAHRFWGVLGLPALKHPPQAWPGPVENEQGEHLSPPMAPPPWAGHGLSGVWGGEGHSRTSSPKGSERRAAVPAWRQQTPPCPAGYTAGPCCCAACRDTSPRTDHTHTSAHLFPTVLPAPHCCHVQLHVRVPAHTCGHRTHAPSPCTRRSPTHPRTPHAQGPDLTPSAPEASTWHIRVPEHARGQGPPSGQHPHHGTFCPASRDGELTASRDGCQDGRTGTVALTQGCLAHIGRLSRRGTC